MVDGSRSWETPIVRCFFRPLYAPVYKHRLGWQKIMELPHEFAATVADKVGQEIELRNTLGEKWPVVLTSYDSTVALGKGWRAFVDRHELEEFDLLVFIWSIDDSHFKVQVYNKLCQEKLSSGIDFYRPRGNCIHRVVLPPGVAVDKIERETELENALWENWTVRFSSYNGGVVFEKGWKEFVEYHNIEDRDILVFKGFNKGSLFEVQVFDGRTFCERACPRSLMRAQQEEQKKRKRNIGNKGTRSQPQAETYGPVTCRAVTSGRELVVIGLPRIFDIRGKRAAERKNVMLLDEKSRLWPATYQAWDGILCSTWGAFAAANGVEDEDMLSFAVHDESQVIYKISVLRSM